MSTLLPLECLSICGQKPSEDLFIAIKEESACDEKDEDVFLNWNSRPIKH